MSENNTKPEATLTSPDGQQTHGSFHKLGSRFFVENLAAAGWTLAKYQEPEQTQELVLQPHQWGEYQAECARMNEEATSAAPQGWDMLPPSITETAAEAIAAAEVTATIARRYSEDQEQALHAAGFATVSTVVSDGSTMVERLGENRARMYWTQRRKQHDKQPLIEDALERVAQVIASENRWQRKVHIKDLCFDGQNLVLPDFGEADGFGERVKIEAGALESWSKFESGQRSEINGEKVKLAPRQKYIVHSTATEIGRMFDSRREYPEWRVTKKGITRPQQIQLLGRDIPGKGRTVYAVASSTYSYGGGDKYLRALANQLRGKGFRGEVKYNSENTRVTGSCFTLADEEAAIHRKVGDSFAYGFKFRTADNGGSGYGINPTVKRDKCDNHAEISTDMMKLTQRRHSGHKSPAAKAQLVVKDAVDALGELASLWSEAWAKLGEVPAEAVFDIDVDKEESPMVQIIEALTTQGGVSLIKGIPAIQGMDSNQRRDLLVEALLVSAEQTQKEGLSRVLYEPSLQDVINTVTRCHDKVPVYAQGDADSIQDHLEKTAGQWVNDWSSTLERDPTTPSGWVSA